MKPYLYSIHQLNVIATMLDVVKPIIIPSREYTRFIMSNKRRELDKPLYTPDVKHHAPLPANETNDTNFPIERQRKSRTTKEERG
jgi:hypothetical protein